MKMTLSRDWVPTYVHGPAALHSNGIPLFFPATWGMFHLSGAAPSTRIKFLRYIENFYRFSADTMNIDIDLALLHIDLDAIEQALDGYLIRLNIRHAAGTDQQRHWETVVRFVHQTILQQRPSLTSVADLEKLEARLHRIQTLYSQMKVGKPRVLEPIRALPESVLEYLFSALDPLSTSNPFKSERTRWQAFVIFTILFRLGLRRGELLLLPIDPVKREFDRRLQRNVHWVNVNGLLMPDETRYSRPSIKTYSSVRQLPVSEATTLVIDEYQASYRPDTTQNHLLISAHRQPLSTESITTIFKTISKHFPTNISKSLADSTGKHAITPHDLRHTCATIRLTQFLDRGDDMELALQKLRAYFGWSKNSLMPFRYSKQVFNRRLLEQWTNEFDNRVEMIRTLHPGKLK